MSPRTGSRRVPYRLRPRRIALVTDFGAGPYTGQVRLLCSGAGLDVVELISTLAPFRSDLASFLLPGLVDRMPARTLYLCVVDPGVGTERHVLAVKLGQNWFLAPDNGLLVPLLRSAAGLAAVWRVDWRPRFASATFHGRDIFTPIALRICSGELPESTPLAPERLVGVALPETLSAICWVDPYGNLISGLTASRVPGDAVVVAGGVPISRARTFGDVAVGEAFWYANAFGLLEIAVNQGRADTRLGLKAGDAVLLSDGALR